MSGGSQPFSSNKQAEHGQKRESKRRRLNDGLNRRIVRDHTGLPLGGGKVEYYYNPKWQILKERKNGDADPLAQYVWHPYYIGALAVRYYDADTDNADIADQYFLQDANFNVTWVVDADGDVLERYDYTPYGEVTFLELDFDVSSPQESAIANTHLYTGRELDPVTGLQLNRNRYYSWILGRWVTRDPIGYRGSEWNLYQYVQSRPVGSIDPKGLQYPYLPVSCPKGTSWDPVLQTCVPWDPMDPSMPGQLYNHYITPGNSAPADPWLLNWGSEIGAGAAIVAGGGAAITAAWPAFGGGAAAGEGAALCGPGVAAACSKSNDIQRLIDGVKQGIENGAIRGDRGQIIIEELQKEICQIIGIN